MFAADVDPDPDSGAAGTELQTILALRRLGHVVDEIWARELGRKIRHGNLHYLLELPWTFRRAVRDHCSVYDYDVIHVNQGHCYLAAIEHQRLRRRGVFVCRSHGLDDHMEQVLRPWRRRLGVVAGRRGLKKMLGTGVDVLLHRHDRLAYEYADGVLVSSRNDANFLTGQRRLAADRVGCVPQAPASIFVDSPALPMDAKRLGRILHVGGFAYWKGVHAVAAVANELFETDGPEEMTWVCRESEHSQVRGLLSPKSRSRLTLRGWTTQVELREIYDTHGIFLNPSLFEGFGKTFLEAMARGLCVIGTPAGGMPDIIRPEQNGFIVDFNDAPAMTSTIRRLRADPEHAAKVSSAAANAAASFSWDRVSRETVDFYERLAEQPRKWR